MDSTHIKANANKHKFTKEMNCGQAKAYQDELEDEINKERILMGKCPFTWDAESELNLRKISHSDPESGHYVKGERKKQFAYSAHASCDDNGLILAEPVTPGNVHVSQVAINLVKQSKRAFPNMKHVVTDVGYKNPKFAHFLAHLKLYPVLLYTCTSWCERGVSQKKILSVMTILNVTYVSIINRCY